VPVFSARTGDSGAYEAGWKRMQAIITAESAACQGGGGGGGGGGTHNVTVAVRLRPVNEREQRLRAGVCVRCEGNAVLLTSRGIGGGGGGSEEQGGGGGGGASGARAGKSGHGQRGSRQKGQQGGGGNEEGKGGGSYDEAGGTTLRFAFDYVFDSACKPNAAGGKAGGGASSGSDYATQRTVFETLGLATLANAWRGLNASLFAYGQTGSGKSYSMQGGGRDLGLIPRVCEYLFAFVERHADPGVEYGVEASYFEVYVARGGALAKARSPAPRLVLSRRLAHSLTHSLTRALLCLSFPLTLTPLLVAPRRHHHHYNYQLQ
jgi:hypothetical protein